MKAFVAIAATAAVLAAAPVQAQYYPYNPYVNPWERHSVPANNYARGYNQGQFNAYTGMAAGSAMFMTGLAARTAPQVVVVPAPVYGGVPPGTPYGVPVPPAYGPYGPAPVPPPYAVPYVQ